MTGTKSNAERRAQRDHQVSKASSASRWIVDLLNVTMVVWWLSLFLLMAESSLRPAAHHKRAPVRSLRITHANIQDTGVECYNSCHPLLSSSNWNFNLIQLCNVALNRGRVRVTTARQHDSEPSTIRATFGHFCSLLIHKLRTTPLRRDSIEWKP